MKLKAISILFFILFSINFSNCASTGAGKTQNKLPALKTVYENYFLIGNIITRRYLDNHYFGLLKTHFNVVTAENQMKPDHLAPREKGGQYNFGPADELVDEILAHNIKVFGHTLVWHNQTHKWMTEGTPQEIRNNMANHINTVLNHFKGRVYAWDVVNEAIVERVNPGEQSQDWRAYLRPESGWNRANTNDMSYVEFAFRTARAADPDIFLYYNDYNLDSSRKATITANMIKDINDRYKAEGNTRNLIDGVGMQAHYGSNTSAPNVRASIEKFIAIGIRIDISELDVTIRSVGSGNFGTGRDSQVLDVDQRTQAIKYAELFKVFKEYGEHITRVSMWGMDDELSWKSLGNPCLWDGFLNPKQAFWAVADPDKTLGIK
ncbi:MAG: endo-1,4-beta-xylanase [Treponema sp.]|nr:endo-1,4-beta-xylanase [Treponema sp.]